jgi:hypothetical protein
MIPMNSPWWFDELPEYMSEAEYRELSEEISRTVEIVHGHVIKCESPTPQHNRIARRLSVALESARSPADPYLTVETDVDEDPVRGRASRHRIAPLHPRFRTGVRVQPGDPAVKRALINPDGHHPALPRPGHPRLRPRHRHHRLAAAGLSHGDSLWDSLIAGCGDTTEVMSMRWFVGDVAKMWPEAGPVNFAGAVLTTFAEAGDVKLRLLSAVLLSDFAAAARTSRPRNGRRRACAAQPAAGTLRGMPVVLGHRRGDQSVSMTRCNAATPRSDATTRSRPHAHAPRASSPPGGAAAGAASAQAAPAAPLGPRWPPPAAPPGPPAERSSPSAPRPAVPAARSASRAASSGMTGTGHHHRDITPARKPTRRAAKRESASRAASQRRNLPQCGGRKCLRPISSRFPTAALLSRLLTGRWRAADTFSVFSVTDIYGRA